MSEYWTAQDQLQARWAYDKPAGRDKSMVRKRGHSMFDKKYRHYREPHHYTTPEYFHCAQSFIDENGNKKLTEGAKIYTEWKDFYKEEDEKYFPRTRLSMMPGGSARGRSSTQDRAFGATLQVLEYRGRTSRPGSTGRPRSR